MARRVALMLCAVAALAGSSAGADPLRVVSEDIPKQYSTVDFVVHSDRIGRDFQVTVTSPGATVFLPGQKLSAVYALDGGDVVAGPMGQNLSNLAAMAPAVIVSVGYPPGQWDHRLFDLAHHAFQPPGLPRTGGGGAAFEAFLLQDLKPWIEAKYPVDPARSVLVGHSAGAMFAANVFADKPEAFAGYVMASVPVWSDPSVVARVKLAAAHAKGERVFLSVAEFDDGANGTHMRAGFDAVAAALAGHSGVILKKRVYPGENHSSYYARLVLDSFPYVLPGVWSKTSPTFPMSPEVLARYTGVYRTPDGQAITVRGTSEGQLTSQMSGGPVVPLYPNGRDRFYAPTSDLDVVFDAKGANLSGGGGAKLRIEKTS